MTLTFVIFAIYHQIKTSIDFWCTWKLNLKSLIQLSEALSIKLTRTHDNNIY